MCTASKNIQTSEDKYLPKSIGNYPFNSSCIQTRMCYNTCLDDEFETCRSIMQNRPTLTHQSHTPNASNNINSVRRIASVNSFPMNTNQRRVFFNGVAKRRRPKVVSSPTHSVLPKLVTQTIAFQPLIIARPATLVQINNRSSRRSKHTLYIVPGAPPTTPTSGMTTPTTLTSPQVFHSETMAPLNNNEFIMDDYQFRSESSSSTQQPTTPTTISQQPTMKETTSPTISPAVSDFTEWNLDLSGSMFNIINQ